MIPPTIPLDQTQLNFTGVGGPLSKLFTDLNSMKTMLLWHQKGGKILTFFSSESTCQIPISFGRNVHWVNLYKKCSSHTDWLKSMSAKRHHKRGKMTKLKNSIFMKFLVLILRKFNGNLTSGILYLICSSHND